VRPRPAHEGDPVDDDDQVLSEDGIHRVLVGREFEDVDAEAANGRDESKVLLAGSNQVDLAAAGLKIGSKLIARLQPRSFTEIRH
jgi:hypothetical protein